MNVKSREKGTTLVFQLDGEITGPTIVDLMNKIEGLKESKYDRVVLDLTDVTFIDSSGLGGMIYAYLLLEKVNKSLILSAPSGFAQRLFRECRLERVMKIVSPEELDV